MESKRHEDDTTLTSGEVSGLWMTCQYESLAVCGIKYFLLHVHDQQIKEILEKSLKLSVRRVQTAREILHNENHLSPEGFTEGDVNLSAPRLFSDELYLEYILHTLQMEFFNYNQSMLTAVKTPVQKFYEEIMKDTINFEMETKELCKQKGLYLRAPHVPPIKTVEYVKKESFLAGWFGDRRPLLAAEISQLVFNAKRNALGQAVITAFSQVATTKEVVQFFEKGRDIAGKHVRVLSEKLSEDYLPNSSLIRTDQVTESVESPFSEKLMMTFITTLITSGIGNYGFAMAMSARHDLGVLYGRLTAEISAYSNEGAQILINNGWLERPPMAADRKILAKKSSK